MRSLVSTSNLLVKLLFFLLCIPFSLLSSSASIKIGAPTSTTLLNQHSSALPSASTPTATTLPSPSTGWASLSLFSIFLFFTAPGASRCRKRRNVVVLLPTTEGTTTAVVVELLELLCADNVTTSTRVSCAPMSITTAGPEVLPLECHPGATVDLVELINVDKFDNVE